MEPITLLIYISTIVIAALWIVLTLVLINVLKILKKVNRILDYIDHVRWLLETWEQLPVKFLTKLSKKFFK